MYLHTIHDNSSTHLPLSHSLSLSICLVRINFFMSKPSECTYIHVHVHTIHDNSSTENSQWTWDGDPGPVQLPPLHLFNSRGLAVACHSFNLSVTISFICLLLVRPALQNVNGASFFFFPCHRAQNSPWHLPLAISQRWLLC